MYYCWFLILWLIAFALYFEILLCWVYVLLLNIQSCLTLGNPMDWAHQAPLSIRILQARSCSGLPCSPPGYFTNPGVEPRSPALPMDSLSPMPPGKPMLGAYIFAIVISSSGIDPMMIMQHPTVCLTVSILESIFFPISFFISWRLITLQYCSGSYHIWTWISHGFTCIPHPDPPSHLPLHLISLGLPGAPGPSTCLMHPTWAGDLFWLIRVLLLQFSFFLISIFMTFFLLSLQFQSAYAPRSKVDLL